MIKSIDKAPLTMSFGVVILCFKSSFACLNNWVSNNVDFACKNSNYLNKDLNMSEGRSSYKTKTQKTCKWGWTKRYPIDILHIPSSGCVPVYIINPIELEFYIP